MEPPAPAPTPAPAPAPIQANLPAVNLNAAPGTNAPDVNMQPSLIKSQKKEAKVVDAQEKAALGELAIAAPNIIPPPTIATASSPQLPPMPAPQQTNPVSLAPPSPAVETARQAVNDLAQPTFQVPAAFNALPLGNILHTENNNVPAPTMTMPMPSNLVPPLTEPTSAPTSVSGSPLAPPPVPPPIINPTPPSF